MPRVRMVLWGLLASVVMAWPAWGQESGIHWQQDIETAKIMAKQSGRLVLVHVWADGCGPCQALEQNVFNQPGVAGAVETKFVPVKLNANEFPATAQGFGITRVPTDVILSPDGQVLQKLISPATPTGYVAELNVAALQFASKSGQTAFDKAAAAAPQPAVLNSAYANLPIGAPATPTAPQATAAIPAKPATVTNSTLPGQPSAPINPPASPYNFASTSVPVAPASSPAAPPAIAAPTNNMANPYVATGAPVTTPMPVAPSAAPQAATAPVAPLQINNPAAQPPMSPMVGEIATAPAAAAPVAEVTTTAGVAAPDARRLPVGAPPLALDGYCPVTMRSTWKWVAGDPKWGAIHRGRTYWFAGPREQQQFLANPDNYCVALSGVDPVLAIDHQQMVPGMREHSLDYDNQFYVFSSEATLQQFTANPERYATGVRQAMGIQPGRQVR